MKIVHSFIQGILVTISTFKGLGRETIAGPPTLTRATTVPHVLPDAA